MPARSGFHPGLIRMYGGTLGERLSSDVDSRLETLGMYLPRQKSRALGFHYRRNILPAVALYRCLLSQGVQPDQAVAAVEKLLAERNAPVARFSAWLDWLPAPFAAFRFILRQQMKLLFPPEGWEVEWRSDLPDLVDFDITRCLYVEAVNGLGHPELTPVFCRQDDILGREIAPYARFERRGTLAQGAACCDFCYRKV